MKRLIKHENVEARIRSRRILVFIVFMIALATSFLGVTPIHAQAQESPHGTQLEDQPVFLIGMSGMGISDIDMSDPHISATMSQLALANLTARTRTALTCPNEGWMSLIVPGDVIDADGRKERSGTSSPCPLFSVSQQGSSGRVNYFNQMTSEVQWPHTSPFGDDALAIGPGAAIATADSSGISPHWRPFSSDVDTLTRLFDGANGSVLVDIGAVRAPRTEPYRQAQVDGLNANLAVVLEAYERAGSPGRLVIASFGDTWTSLQLQAYAIEYDDAEGPALIHAGTTRTTGLVTIANLRDEVAGGDSSTTFVRQSSLDAAVAHLTDMEDHVYAAGRSTATWYQVFNGLGIIGVLGVIAVFFLRGTPSPHWKRLAFFNTFVFAFVPAALILNVRPWWRLVADSGPALTRLVAIGLTIVIAGLITLFARLTRHPVGVVAIVAFVVLSVDIILGSVHQQNGFMGSLVMTSRRYYGISNRTYIILVVAGLLACLPWIRRHVLTSSKVAAGGVVGVGVVALLVDSVPMWGADFGGPPGIVAGFGLAAIMVAGVKFRWWFVVVWLAVTGGTMAIMGLIDSRSDSGSHIGGFWSSLGTENSWTMIQSKIRDVLRSFVGRPDILALIVVVTIAVIVGVVGFRRLARNGSIYADRLRYAVAEPGTVAVIVGVIVGILVAVPVNDSGALMIKEGIFIAMPAVAALLAQRLANSEPDTFSVDPGSAGTGSDNKTSQKVLEN